MPAAKLSSEDLPPCIYSINAFGPQAIRGYSNPPGFFYGGAKRTEWNIPEATVCVWPYEAMYGEDVYNEGGYLDNDRRSAKADEFFGSIEPGRSLIFFYANYSNPFSEEESPRYALIGVSRVKKVGGRLVYDESNDYVRERFAGGLIWARNVSSYYPDEGLRLPYHRYRDDPETLQRIAVFPENPRTCKYGARLLTNDDAIGLLEQLLSVVYELKALGDQSEDWDERERWLLGCITELWGKRGLYPGLLNVMALPVCRKSYQTRAGSHGNRPVQRGASPLFRGGGQGQRRSSTRTDGQYAATSFAAMAPQTGKRAESAAQCFAAP